MVVQRGHVPRTTGATGGPGEQAMARRIAERIRLYVERIDGWTVRIIDADEPASRYVGDAFVALHGDASASPQAAGASVGWRTPEGQALGQAWKDCYRRFGWPGGFRNDNYTANLAGYYGTRHAVAQRNSRAVIVEHGFLTNPDERRWIDSDAGTEAAARAAVAAVTGIDPMEDDMTPEQDARLRRVEDQLATVVKALGGRYTDDTVDDGPNTNRVGNDLRRIRLDVRDLAVKAGIEPRS